MRYNNLKNLLIIIFLVNGSLIYAQDDTVWWENPNTYLWVSVALLVVSLIAVGYLVNLLFAKTEKIERLKKKIESLKNQENTNFQQIVGTNEINDLKRKIKDLESEIETLKEEKNKSQAIEYIEEKPSPVINLTVDAPPEILFFYAGKPNAEMEFTEVSNMPIEGITIYKLTYINDSKIISEFEIDPTESILNEIVNFPDNYLYRVCNKKNFNNDFQSKIITEKKGIAHLINGVWKVKGNDDKAIIKFI